MFDHYVHNVCNYELISIISLFRFDLFFAKSVTVFLFLASCFFPPALSSFLSSFHRSLSPVLSQPSETLHPHLLPSSNSEPSLLTVEYPQLIFFFFLHFIFILGFISILFWKHSFFSFDRICLNHLISKAGHCMVDLWFKNIFLYVQTFCTVKFLVCTLSWML